MSDNNDNSNFARKLLNLIAEPEFVKFEHTLSEPNFFKIVGRTHFERWHSAFWGWLLDPLGSHLLSDYVLRRFLLLLLDEKCLRSSLHSELKLANFLSFVEFTKIQVSPNENSPIETSVASVGRFDIFVSAEYALDAKNMGNLNAIFELKIESNPDSKQSNKYANWLYTNHPNDFNLLIFVTPELLHDSRSTVGDERWHCLDYQTLNDKLLIPLLDHPSLNEKVKPFIVQYIKNLRIHYRGVKMAITDEEKRLAVALYEKYGDVFDSIYDALLYSGTIDFSTSDIRRNKGRSTGKIAVRINHQIFSNKNVWLLFLDILKYLVETDLVTKIPLPWGTSKNRFTITNERPPIHPNGRDFFVPVSYKGYTMESHYARDRAIRVLDDLCEKLEVEFETVEI